MNKKTTKPETLISFEDVPRILIIQTVNLDGKTFAWLDDDGRYVSTVEGINRFEDSARQWFSEWFDVRPSQEVKINSHNEGRLNNSRTFVFRIRNK